MYHEEKVINGVLCFRNHPKSKFRQCTKKMLTEKIERLDREIAKLKG